MLASWVWKEKDFYHGLWIQSVHSVRFFVSFRNNFFWKPILVEEISILTFLTAWSRFEFESNLQIKVKFSLLKRRIRICKSKYSIIYHFQKAKWESKNESQKSCTLTARFFSSITRNALEVWILHDSSYLRQLDSPLWLWLKACFFLSSFISHVLKYHGF